jgi:4'-phosphopantetheinyl transferase EntD
VTLDVLFRLDLPQGRCVAVRVPDAVDDALVATLPREEQVAVAALSEARRPTWVAGRVALRAAAADAGLRVGAVLATDRGAPALPEGVMGSISHKRHVAIGLAAPRTDADVHVGVDVEVDAPLRVDIRRRVLTDSEHARVHDDRGVLLHLSAKEALYKALDPFLRRYVAFREVEAVFADDGAVAFPLLPAADLAATGAWRARDDLIVTAATVRRRDPRRTANPP